MKKLQAILVDDEYWGLKRLENECAAFDRIEIAGRFRSGAHAVEFARQHPVDVAFLDIEMPKMNGYEVSAQLRALHPGITVVYTSAEDKDAWVCANTGRLAPQKDFYIEKPYEVAEVADVLTRAALL